MSISESKDEARDRRLFLSSNGGDGQLYPSGRYVLDGQRGVAPVEDLRGPPAVDSDIFRPFRELQGSGYRANIRRCASTEVVIAEELQHLSGEPLDLSAATRSVIHVRAEDGSY